MATEKAETDRVPVTVALSTIAYLEKLVRQGTHGTSVPGVARTLIEEGIRLAIKDGLLSIRDNGNADARRVFYGFRGQNDPERIPLNPTHACANLDRRTT